MVQSGNQLTLPLDEIYAPIAGELGEVETLLRQEMRSQYSFVDELVRYGCLLGGKRLRPALLLLSAKCAGSVTPNHIKLATVIEMIHTATLVHDDVLDGAHVRRHLATVNARWDDQASLLLGDFLFSHAFYLASTTGSAAACELIGRATNIVCEGEIRQKGSRADYSLSEEEYLSILDAKTAELCACSCRLGAEFAQATGEATRRLARYGQQLGIAFQIADDLLDIDGDEAATGKSLGTDLEQQKPTLPIIRALELSDSAQRRQLLALLHDPAQRHGTELRRRLADLDVLQYTRDQARQFADQALAQLDYFPTSPAEQSLRRMGEFVVSRTH